MELQGRLGRRESQGLGKGGRGSQGHGGDTQTARLFMGALPEEAANRIISDAHREHTES